MWKVTASWSRGVRAALPASRVLSLKADEVNRLQHGGMRCPGAQTGPKRFEAAQAAPDGALAPASRCCHLPVKVSSTGALALTQGSPLPCLSVGSKYSMTGQCRAKGRCPACHLCRPQQRWLYLLATDQGNSPYCAAFSSQRPPRPVSTSATGGRLLSSKAWQGPKGTDCSWATQPTSKVDTVYGQPTRPASR